MASALPRRFAHRVDLRARGRRRLLDPDVDTRPQAVDGDAWIQWPPALVIADDDEHRVERLFFQHFPIIAIGALGAELGRERLRLLDPQIARGDEPHRRELERRVDVAE